MTTGNARLFLHALCAEYGEETIIRRIVIGIHDTEVRLTERWRHPPQTHGGTHAEADEVTGFGDESPEVG